MDKSPPYSEEAECGVLGSLILDFSRVYDLCVEEGVTRDTFYITKHQIIWDGFSDIYKSGKTADSLSISERLKSLGKLDDVGGDMYLNSLIDKTPTSAHAEYYIEIIIKKEKRRQLIDFSRRVAASAFNEEEELDKVVEMASSLSLKQSKEESDTLKELCVKALKEWEEAEKGGFMGAPSGWKSLNAYLGGYRYGWVTAVGGYQRQGKSLYMGNEALYMAKNGIPALIISLEMTAEQIVQRMIGNVGEFSTFKFDTGKATDEDKKRAEEAREIIHELPIYIRTGNFTIERIAQMIRYYSKHKGVKVVFIDYIQLVTSSKRMENRTKELDYISRTLALTTLSSKVSTIILSQFSRDAQKRGEVPRLDSFRDSGSIENDARQCILIYEHPDRGDVHIFEVAKNNMGPCGTVEMRRVGNRQRWEENGEWYKREEREQSW